MASVARDVVEIGKTVYRIGKAKAALKVCDRDGHLWDDSVPSPQGKRFCSRCSERYSA